MADSYAASIAREARSVAELAATKKEDKYSGLAADYLFQPIAVEILGPVIESASDFLSLLAKKISQHSGDERETEFLFQRVSALAQRYNSVLRLPVVMVIPIQFLFSIHLKKNPSGY